MARYANLRRRIRVLKTEWSSPASTSFRITNLPKTACDIDTAYFIVQGQDDIVTPTQAAVDYFRCIKSPKKELILIPNAGHFAFMTASDRFLEALTSKVRPVAIARGA